MSIRTVNDIPAKWRKRAEIVPGKIDPASVPRVAAELRYEARLAYLDDRNAQAAKFNRYATILERAAKKLTTADAAAS